MCNNIIVLSIFILLKLISFIILPIIIFLKRKKKKIIILIIVDIILLLFFIICNTFNINACVYNSNIEGIKRTINKNRIELYTSLHTERSRVYSSEGIEPNKNYKTIKNRSLYYFNQNRDYMNDAYYECNGNKVYMDTFGSGFTAFSTVISTLYDNNINPVQLLDIYKTYNKDMCTNKIELTDIYNSTMKVYGGIVMTEISSNQINSALRQDGYVIAELSANENSKLTCDNGYIIIYNVSRDGKYMIADPSLKDTSYVCPYSSEAYGNIIKSDNMEKSWSLEEIDNEAIRYYLIKKG